MGAQFFDQSRFSGTVLLYVRIWRMTGLLAAGPRQRPFHVARGLSRTACRRGRDWRHQGGSVHAHVEPKGGDLLDLLAPSGFQK